MQYQKKHTYQAGLDLPVQDCPVKSAGGDDELHSNTAQLTLQESESELKHSMLLLQL